MYSNNILNFRVSKPILNACTKKSGNLLNEPRMSILCSATVAVSFVSWPILFKVLTLNFAMCTVPLHQNNFSLGLGLSSVADFSNNVYRALNSVERAL